MAGVPEEVTGTVGEVVGQGEETVEGPTQVTVPTNPAGLEGGVTVDPGSGSVGVGVDAGSGSIDAGAGSGSQDLTVRLGD